MFKSTQNQTPQFPLSLITKHDPKGVSNIGFFPFHSPTPPHRSLVVVLWALFLTPPPVSDLFDNNFRDCFTVLGCARITICLLLMWFRFMSVRPVRGGMCKGAKDDVAINSSSCTVRQTVLRFALWESGERGKGSVSRLTRLHLCVSALLCLHTACTAYPRPHTLFADNPFRKPPLSSDRLQKEQRRRCLEWM